jgi:lipoprotein-anchoring transpeptidase ErfK/SrfK
MKRLSALRSAAFIAALFLVAVPAAYGQKEWTPTSTQPPAPPKITNIKVIEEYLDGKGNIVRKVQYDQGLMRVTETIIAPKPVKWGDAVAVRPDTLRPEHVRILVDKSDYAVAVYYRGRPIRLYRAVFGPRPMDNKCMEGDRCTPEGTFTILRKNPASQYNKFMQISYPNDSAKVRFARLQEQGIVPKTARIGGDIGIHGIWPGGDDLIKLGVGWTDGCVALCNKDVDELFAMTGVGTKVIIQK